MAAADDSTGQPEGLVLALNSGSSSAKSAMLAPESVDRVLGGMAEKVGTPDAVLRIRRHPDSAGEERLPDERLPRRQLSRRHRPDPRPPDRSRAR